MAVLLLSLSTSLSVGVHRLLAQQEGARPEQAGPRRGDVQSAAAGAGADDQADCQRHHRGHQAARRWRRRRGGVRKSLRI